LAKASLALTEELIQRKSLLPWLWQAYTFAGPLVKVNVCWKGPESLVLVTLAPPSTLPAPHVPLP
jgi:hypothetical protein